MKKGMIAIIIICLLLGYAVGYGMGVRWAFNWGVDRAISFFSMKGVDLQIDKEALVNALIMYYIQMGDKYPTLNATLIEPVK